MERYEKYKDSGVEWIGEIPGEWEVKAFRYCANNFGNGTTASQREFETEYPVSRIETISTGEINFKKTGFLNKEDAIEKYKLGEPKQCWLHLPGFMPNAILKSLNAT